MQFSRCLRVLTQAGTTPFRWLSCEVPPVPIPNTEVKLTYTDNTWLATAREDRQPPGPQESLQSSGSFFLPCLPFYRKSDSGNRGTSICDDKMFRLLLFFVRLIGIISLYKILHRKKFFCYWRGLDNYAAIGHAQTDEQIREQTGRACSVVLRNLNRIAKTHRTGTFPLFGAFLLE